MDYLAGIQGNKVKFKDDGGNTDGAAQIQQAQNELASIFQEQESVNTEIETKETELAENNEQEQQQVQEITDGLASAQSDFEAAHSAFQEADSSASSAESNANALAAAAESLPKEIEEQEPDGTNPDGSTKFKTVKKPNPAYIAAKAEAEAAKAQADELRNQANSLKEQEAQAQEVCNEIIETLSELESEQEEKEQEAEEKDSELETLKEQYNQFQERINELNTEIEQAEQEAQQEEKEPDEEGMALYESANTIDGMDQRYVDNGDGTRTIINPDGTQSTVAIDEKTGNITGITDNEGNSTTYEFNTTKDKEGNVTANLNKSTTKEKGTNSRLTTELDKNGVFDAQKTDEQDADKDETIVTSGTDTDTGIKTTIDENGEVTYKDENGEELSQRDVRERRYEESLDDCRPKEQPCDVSDTPNASEEPKEPTDSNKEIRESETDEPEGSETDEHELTYEDQDISQAEAHIKELEENPDKVFTELLQEDTTKAVNIMEYAKYIEKEFIDALYSLPENKKNEYTDQIIDTLIDFGENTYNSAKTGNFVLDILKNKDDNSSNFFERFVEKAPNEFLEKCFEDNRFTKDMADLLPYVTETACTKLEECGLNKAYTRVLEEKGLNGKIEDSSQGHIADCWLLSGVNALSYSEAGQKLLSDAVTKKEDGSGYLINFKGLNKEVEISSKEILDAINSYQYSSGDADMVMWELAFEKVSSNNILYKAENFVMETADKLTGEDEDHHTNIAGGTLDRAIKAISGKPIVYNMDLTKAYSLDLLAKSLPESIQKIGKIASTALTPGISISDANNKLINSIFDEMESSKSIVATVDFSVVIDRHITDIEGNEVTLYGSHAYAIKSIQGNNVTIINPWNSNEEIVITRKDLIDNMSEMDYADLSE